MALVELLGFFQSLVYKRECEIKSMPGYQEKVDALRKFLPELDPIQFKKLPEITQVALVSQYTEITSIYPLVKECAKAQEAAFAVPQFRRHICKAICTWDMERTSLTVDSYFLKTEHLFKVFEEEIAEKDKTRLTSLDLKGCHFIRSFTWNIKSLFEGLANLRELITPHSIFIETIEGIKALKETLEVLDLSESGGESLDDLREFKRLHTLNAKRCGKLQDIYGIAHLPIRQLNLGGCPTSFEILEKVLPTLSQLEIADLAQTYPLRDISPFQNLSKLKRLTVSRLTKTEGFSLVNPDCEINKA